MKVTVNLNLPKMFNSFEVRYHTFEKVSYDKYLIASVVKNSESKNEALQFIDDLTGKGSLNNHFKKIYEEITYLPEEELMKVLKYSEYPVQRIDKYKYIYIPLLDVSIFNHKVIQGNIANDEMFTRLLVNKNGTYIESIYHQSDPVTNKDIYEVLLEEEYIKILIEDVYCEINDNDFQRIVYKESMDLSLYNGETYTNLKNSGWFQLTNSTLNNILNAQDYYYENGNHFGIYNNYVRESKIGYSWGLYWINESTFYYDSPKNNEICEKVAHVLLESGRINEFKTKSMINIINNTNRDLQQRLINYILQRKNSKELALIAFILIDKGYEKGWDLEVTNTLYRFKESDKHLVALYKVNAYMNYTIEEILKIYKYNKKILNDTDLKKVHEYENSILQIRDSIKIKIGDIMSSTTREDIKSMKLNENNIKLKKMINEKIAHNKKDIQKMDLEQLKQYAETVDQMHKLYLKVNHELQNSKENEN